MEEVSISPSAYHTIEISNQSTVTDEEEEYLLYVSRKGVPPVIPPHQALHTPLPIFLRVFRGPDELGFEILLDGAPFLLHEGDEVGDVERFERGVSSQE
jgi:hypothetical protein